MSCLERELYPKRQKKKKSSVLINSSFSEYTFVIMVFVFLQRPYLMSFYLRGHSL